MADDAGRGAAGERLGRWRSRLSDRLPLLSAALAVLVVLLAFGALHWAGALVATLLLAVAAVAIPGPTEQAALELASAGPQALGDTALQRFADALPDPCLLLDRRSVVIHRNGAAAEQFPDVRPGNPIAFAMRAPTVLSAIDAVRRTGVGATVELHQTVPTETWHRTSIMPLVSGDGGGLLIVTLRSLTDEKRLESLRTDFVANASHELRTPLTSLLGFIDTLMGPASKDPAAQKKFLEIMRSQAVRMSKLIDDLLSLSRIEMRQHVRPTGTLDLALLLREVTEGLSTQAAEAGVSIDVAVPDAKAMVTGDRDELYEVFENLIDNALKYGASGGKVDVALAPAGRQGYEYLATVTDYGAGVEAEHVPRLTERFYRVDVESSRRKKGTGLGLAIVKHIITRHRGLLTIRSRPGQGTSVEVLLSA